MTKKRRKPYERTVTKDWPVVSSLEEYRNLGPGCYIITGEAAEEALRVNILNAVKVGERKK